MTILRLPLPIRRAPHHDLPPLRILGAIQGDGGDEEFARSATSVSRYGRDVLRRRGGNGRAVARRGPVAAMVLSVPRGRTGTTIIEPEGAGLFGDRRRTLGDGIFAACLLADDAYDNAELQDRHRRHRRLRPLVSPKTPGGIALAQLTERGTETRFRRRLQRERFDPSEVGRRPAREFRAPARFASELRMVGTRACSTL
jgi:hypothetical protein